MEEAMNACRKPATKTALPPWQRGRAAFRDWLSASWKVKAPEPTEGQEHWGEADAGWFANTRAALRKVETFDDPQARNRAKRARKAARA